MAIIFGYNPAVDEYDVAVLREPFDLPQVAVVQPASIFRESVLRDSNHFTGSQSNLAGFIHLKPSGLVQRKERGFITPAPDLNALLICLSHGHPFAAPESGNILMKLDHQAGTIVPCIGALRLRPLQAF